MKSLVTLWYHLAKDLDKWCRTSTERDYKTVLLRAKQEGESFLTITLPAFGKQFESCLERGVIVTSDFPGFCRSNRGPLPLFLGGFLSQVFDPASGVILDTPNLDAVFAIRQLTAVYGKIFEVATPQRNRKALKQYVQIEKELAHSSNGISWKDRSDLSRIATLLFGDAFSAVEQKLFSGEVGPRHGPGAVADRLGANGRYRLPSWSNRLEEIFPYVDYALPSHRHHQMVDGVQFFEPEAEPPVRVVLVPKTQKTPRVIAIEPSYMQYMQQGIGRLLVEELERKSCSFSSRDNLVHGMVGFRDQLPNRELARIGSVDRSLATIDLSEASDRVSLQHVRLLLANFPFLRESVEATRSRKAAVPGHGVMPLSKFASMGSALCFPIEACVFLTLVFLGVERSLPMPLDRSLVQQLVGSVRVYGDDIIVPTPMVRSVISCLEDFGLKVNRSKTFSEGNFRESCGGDYFRGEDVTPIRLRKRLPKSRTDASGVQGLVAFRNLLYRRGLWGTCAYLDSKVIKPILPAFPIVEPTSPIIGRHSFLPYQAESFDSRLHIPLVTGYVAKPRIPIDNLDGVAALMKVFINQGLEPLAVDHLMRQGRPRVVDIKRVKRAPF
jgi:hypothetical protein